MKQKRFVAILLMVCMLSALIAGCQSNTGNVNGPNGDSTVEPNNSAEKDTVIIAQAEEPTAMITIDSSIPSNQNKDAIIAHQIYDTLFILENDGTLTPRLAKDYTVTDDGLEYVITIRDDVYFHNGDKLTAEDVAFTFTEYALSVISVTTLWLCILAKWWNMHQKRSCFVIRCTPIHRHYCRRFLLQI